MQSGTGTLRVKKYKQNKISSHVLFSWHIHGAVPTKQNHDDDDDEQIISSLMNINIWHFTFFFEKRSIKYLQNNHAQCLMERCYTIKCLRFTTCS